VRDIVAVTEGPEDVAAVIEGLPSELHGLTMHKALGLHPERASMEALAPMLAAIRRHRDAIACVGEVGLDFSPHVLGSEDPTACKSVQQECLRAQVALAGGEGGGLASFVF
jgi:Tat protein secretion system quality control protein TatD with DNase activity